MAFAVYERTTDQRALRAWESTDSGETWAEVRHKDGLPGNRLAFLTPDHWVSERSESGELFVTRDAGRHWEAILTEGLPRGRRYGLAFTNATDGMILIGTPEDLGNVWVELFVTQDGGRTWRLAKLDPPA